MEKLPPPTKIKILRSFPEHVGFYKRFVKYFSKIRRPLSTFLKLNRPYISYEQCLRAFETLKTTLVTTPILIALIGRNRSNSFVMR